jgi:hypothetical protein
VIDRQNGPYEAFLMSSNTVYDYAVIGGGLSGLYIASRVSQETKNIILIEASESLGGANKISTFSKATPNNGLRIVSATAANEKSILELESFLGLKLIKGQISHPLISYEASGLKNFVGFGEHPPEFYDALSPFLTNERLEFHLEPAAWISLLADKYLGQTALRSYVTRVQFDANSETYTLIVNGAKTIKAKNIVYTGAIKGLAQILNEEHFVQRAKQRVLRGPYWTCICLDLVHEAHVTSSQSVHVLNGTTQDEIGPCIGAFMPSIDAESQTSQWMTFINEEVTEDSETLALALKKMKRQIKRAYPQALEGKVKERIYIAPMIVGNGDLKLNANQSLPLLNNFWVASSAVSHGAGVVCALSQASLVLSSLGFSNSSNLSFAQEPTPVLTP